jgi:hypothetical protein
MAVPKKKIVLVTAALVLTALVAGGAWFWFAVSDSLEHPGPGMSGWQCDPNAEDC